MASQPWNLGPRPMDFSAAFANINRGLDTLGQGLERQWQRKRYAEIGDKVKSGDLSGAATGLLALGDVGNAAAFLKLSQDAENRLAGQEATRTLGNAIGGLSGLGQRAMPAPTATPSNPNAVQSEFVDGVRSAGLTNPIGLGAVAAYGDAESSFSPQNVNRTWSDPAQSGTPGVSGGIMSWREDRLRNLQRFAAGHGEQGNGSPQTQALFLAQEDPTLLPKLQAARSPEEANSILAEAWKFAGWNRSGGENARRLALTQQYADRFGRADMPART